MEVCRVWKNEKFHAKAGSEPANKGLKAGKLYKVAAANILLILI